MHQYVRRGDDEKECANRSEQVSIRMCILPTYCTFHRKHSSQITEVPSSLPTCSICIVLTNSHTHHLIIINSCCPLPVVYISILVCPMSCIDACTMPLK
jgi:hypothetical protein